MAKISLWNIFLVIVKIAIQSLKVTVNVQKENPNIQEITFQILFPSP